jgi:hypothetical protein
MFVGFGREDPTIVNMDVRGLRNWFVMVNVPHNKSINYTSAIRKNVIDKINIMLKTDIEKYIISESTLSPIDIENQTSSFGSLYGNSSNNKFAAF